MRFEINVSLNGRHFFATAERSIPNRAKCEKVAEVFLQKFPESEGYTISVSFVPEVSYDVDITKSTDLKKDIASTTDTY